jgi:hypothetical protein
VEGTGQFQRRASAVARLANPEVALDDEDPRSFDIFIRHLFRFRHGAHLPNGVGIGK